MPFDIWPTWIERVSREPDTNSFFKKLDEKLGALPVAEMLLLNIIRASQQKPMYLTGLADVSMTDTAPGFKVQNLDNKEFVKAVHTPVTLDTLGLFLSLRWPPEFLFYMFTESVVAGGEPVPNIVYSVAKIEERYGAEALQTIFHGEQRLFDFKQHVQTLSRQAEVKLVDVRRIPAGPILDASAVEQQQLLAQILALEEKGISLVEACQVMRNFTSGTSNISLPVGFLTGVTCGAGDAKKYVALKSTLKKVLAYKARKPDGATVGCTVSTSMRTEREKGAAPVECVIDQINLRSLYGMLQFLGEITQAYVLDGTKPKKPVGVPGVFGNRDVSLFAVWKGRADSKAALSTEYDGETYSIPATDNHLSMLSLNLISQLISLL